ncbi:class I SAM-dependent DNA methyltransferase [Actinomycetospora aeridis]|uniref:Class I SAM-dependent methyltransferase n=1 Tax=Actinomycetospora aeridis TaxID=3129231 RepID=A0ABU8N9L4_9PSEU
MPSDRASTRAGYDAIAEAYAEHFRDELAGSALDRAVLGAFAELVEGAGGEVLEAGSGPGGVAAYLHALGVPVRGVDLSPAMVALARREHPGIRFDVGDMAALDVPDGSLGGLLAWYSLIHVPAPELPAVLGEFRRVLRPGGHLLVAFQVGDDVSHQDEAFGHPVSLDFRRLQPDAVAALLEAAGFDVTARVVRTAEQASRARALPQASMLARRP